VKRRDQVLRDQVYNRWVGLIDIDKQDFYVLDIHPWEAYLGPATILDEESGLNSIDLGAAGIGMGPVEIATCQL
jgi:hypothetical protein